MRHHERLNKVRVELAQSVGLPLIEMEQHLDNALTAGATLQAAAIGGRRAAHLPLEAGQDALDLIASAQAGMLAARRQVHEAHRLLRQYQDQLQLGPVSYGDYGDSPEESATPRGGLTVVETVAQAA